MEVTGRDQALGDTSVPPLCARLRVPKPYGTGLGAAPPGAWHRGHPPGPCPVPRCRPRVPVPAETRSPSHVSSLNRSASLSYHERSDSVSSPVGGSNNQLNAGAPYVADFSVRALTDLQFVKVRLRGAGGRPGPPGGPNPPPQSSSIPPADHAAGVPERPHRLPHGQLSPVPGQQRPQTRPAGETGARRRDHQPAEREELPEPPEQPQPHGELHLTPAAGQGRVGTPAAALRGDPAPLRNAPVATERVRGRAGRPGNGRARRSPQAPAARSEREPGFAAAAFWRLIPWFQRGGGRRPRGRADVCSRAAQGASGPAGRAPPTASPGVFSGLLLRGR